MKGGKTSRDQRTLKLRIDIVVCRGRGTSSLWELANWRLYGTSIHVRDDKNVIRNGPRDNDNVPWNWPERSALAMLDMFCSVQLKVLECDEDVITL